MLGSLQTVLTTFLKYFLFFLSGGIEMKVNMHTQFCLISLFTFIFNYCDDCHGYVHDHTSEESPAHMSNGYQILEEPYLQNGASQLSTGKSPLPEAEHEQKYFIEKLFHRYGENGGLSYYGLEKLLSSLGLGEVKVVEIGHEDIGHDPVSHLDAIDVQEGKHLHIHDQIESNSHKDGNNESKTVSTKEFNKCNKRKAAVPTEHEFTHRNHLDLHVHNSTYHSHNSQHKGNTALNNVTLEGETNELLTATNTTQVQGKQKLRKHKKRPKGTKNSKSTVGSKFDFEQARDENKHGYRLDHNLTSSPIPGNVDEAILESKEHRQGSEYSRRKKHKREAPNDQTGITVNADFPKSHSQHDDEVHEHDEVSVGYISFICKYSV